MRITAIVSVYNRASLLKKSLHCLNSQSRQPDEVIISDDGSREDVVGAIRQLLDGYSFRLKYVRQSDKGFRLAKCRNNGIREAEGDYLVFLDQDILATRGYLKAFADSGREGEFLVSYPVWLTQEQSAGVTDDMIAEGRYSGVLTDRQLKRIRSQFYKDSFYYWMRRIFGTYGNRPKVRGSCFGIHRKHLIHVDGFDENYQGWGNEDDDLGSRLYRAGIVGRTVFRSDFPIHVYHSKQHTDGDGGEIRPNRSYYEARLKAIKRGETKAVNGISNPLDDERIEVLNLK